MKSASSIIRIILIIVILGTLGGLGWWYLFLKSETRTTIALNTARGLGSVVPTFVGTIGSTYQNVVNSITGHTNDTATSTVSTERAWEVDASEVSGFGFVNTPTGLSLYYAQLATGYIISADPIARKATRITNTLIPKVYEAYFNSSGVVVLRTLSSDGTLTTISALIATSSSATSSPDTPLTLVTHNLPTNISAIALQPSGKSLLYETSDPVEGASLIQSDWTGAKPKTLTTSPLVGWKLFWLPDNRIILAQKPSDDALGYAYSVDKNGNLVPYVRGIPGLTIAPQASSSGLIFGASQNGTQNLYAQSGTSTSIVRIPLMTRADKCVWSPNSKTTVYCAASQTAIGGQYLNDSNRGVLRTSDSWWQIDTTSGSSSVLYAPTDTGNVSFDVSHPAISPSGEYIAFMNATDRSLWLLRVKK